MNVFGMNSLHSSLFVILVAWLFIWSNNNINDANADGPKCEACKSAGESCFEGVECCSTICAPSDEDNGKHFCDKGLMGECCNNSNDCGTMLRCEARRCEHMQSD